ncbi:MAG: chromate efflux transporter [Hyphomicrobium sp.]|uniref:chromate efflux transporter n=1 Tax=Hyphomicrobium sp. TaxID=82 RepID=UPI0039E2744E
MSEQPEAVVGPSFAEARNAWARIGLMSFGGPAGQIAMMHKVIVDEKRWLDEESFLLALNFCMLLPGPEAMQLATYTGWRLHGTRGGLAAGLLFVAPGALIILLITILYANFGSVPLVSALFGGIKAAVLAIVVEALLRIAGRSLKGWTEWLIAAFSFVAIFLIKIPFPLIVLAAAVIGFGKTLLQAPREVAPLPAMAAVPIVTTLKTVSIWVAVWTLPLAAIALLFGFEHVLAQLAAFFSKLAVVTFGGAYASLAYMAQAVVETYRWLKPGEMLDGLGLAETTPGPLILVNEFVGYLAAARHGGGSPLGFGVLGAVVTLWATFAPSFLFVFAGAPYVERLKFAPRLKGALSAIGAAVVGVIFNLSLWFSLHVFFRARTELTLGPLRLEVPTLASIDFAAVALAVLAAILLFVLRLGIVATLGISAIASLMLGLFA